MINSTNVKYLVELEKQLSEDLAEQADWV